MHFGCSLDVGDCTFERIVVGCIVSPKSNIEGQGWLVVVRWETFFWGGKGIIDRQDTDVVCV
jgi:hypothetical protein